MIQVLTTLMFKIIMQSESNKVTYVALFVHIVLFIISKEENIIN